MTIPIPYTGYKRRIGVYMKDPVEFMLFKNVGIYKNTWGDLKFVLAVKGHTVFRLFYDSKEVKHDG